MAGLLRLNAAKTLERRGAQTNVAGRDMASEAFAARGALGFLHKAGGGADDGMVLTHGAGGNCNAPLLVAVADAFQTAGVTVFRCNLQFRQQRPSGPPRPGDAAKDRAGLGAAVAAMRELSPGRMVLAGLSYGGRQASMLATEEPQLVEALMLLSYPLHPPGKPEQKRTAHFPLLRMPALFVHGSNDPFGSISEMEAALTLIAAPHELMAIEGAGHDLRRGRFDLAAVTGSLSRLLPRARDAALR